MRERRKKYPMKAEPSKASGRHTPSDAGQSLRLILVRHAQTAWNAEERIQGHLEVPLDEVGRWQAHRIGTRLQADPSLLPIEKIYTSDLRRAWETAHLIAERLTAPVEVMPELRERCWGNWQGLTEAEIATCYPEEFASYREDPLHYAPPGAETITQFWNRVAKAFAYLRTVHTQGQVIVVAHGGSLRIILSLALKGGWELARCLYLHNASISMIEWNRQLPTLLLLNDTCHLQTDQEE